MTLATAPPQFKRNTRTPHGPESLSHCHSSLSSGRKPIRGLARDRDSVVGHKLPLRMEEAGQKWDGRQRMVDEQVVVDINPDYRHEMVESDA